MLLEIITTTDGRHLGRQFDSADSPIRLDADEDFTPDRIWQTGAGMWRAANSNYVIDAKEVTNA